MRVPECCICGETANDYLALSMTTGNSHAQMSYNRMAFCCPNHLRQWADSITWGEHPNE
jgi:hypothetical protein